MNDEKPKVAGWNFDSQDITKSPEMQTYRPTVSWDNAGANMADDVHQRHAMKWYVSVPLYFTIILVAFFISNVVALILEILTAIPVITSIARSKQQAHFKRSQLIGWLVFYGFFAIVLMLI